MRLPFAHSTEVVDLQPNETVERRGNEQTRLLSYVDPQCAVLLRDGCVIFIVYALSVTALFTLVVLLVSLHNNELPSFPFLDNNSTI